MACRSRLAEEADQRVHGTLKEVVRERFTCEQPSLQPLRPSRYDTAYREFRQVAWDAYIEVHGNRYSVPGHLAGQTVEVRIGLDDSLRIFDPKDPDPQKLPVAVHRLRNVREGWVTAPEHHADLWKEALQVETRPLLVYEEATQWNS